ncbi:synapsin-1-like [Anguilla anguilla]|uniref:synapsin-1-like n=1 Tax=Anguilla anguilla TaxID=7936 RepID=UPI0015AE7E11|nr:synapsin-1-like [Anguilla anguilla]
MGYSPEDHRRRFQTAKLGPSDRPFVFSQHLRDAATRWLKPGESAGEQRVLRVVGLGQFVEGLPASTAPWVRCHRPRDMEAAVALAEDHLAEHPQRPAEEGRTPAMQRPTPAPRRKPPPSPSSRSVRPPPRPRTNPPSASPVPPRVPAATGTVPTSQGAPQTSGQECWRCGQPGHFCSEYPLMEVGQVIRVAGPPASSPGSGETYSVPACGLAPVSTFPVTLAMRAKSDGELRRGWNAGQSRPECTPERTRKALAPTMGIYRPRPRHYTVLLCCVLRCLISDVTCV